ncbi:MAG TPA: rhodanese-like domain-containing protein [Epulopiscium sp.]|nr:rhodanese-like domain-containing protein [Candidatus Epulonipiscium sp.]
MDKLLMALVAVALLILFGWTVSMRKEKINSENGDYVIGKYNRITAKEAKEIMDTEEVIILDVRTPQEYQEEHIEGALLIPDYDLSSLADSKLPNKDEKILIYCRSGSRSRGAAKVLIDMGYTNVHDFGGIMSWTYDKVKGE